MLGPPGVGKTLLASIVAAELGSQFHEELAQNLLTPGHVHGVMMMLEPGSVLFLDEIHSAPPAAFVTLLKCLEERRLFLGGDRKVVELPPFTLIGATTDAWALSGPLMQRFKLILQMEHYTAEELAMLIRQRTKRLGWEITDDAVMNIALKGRGVPRLAIRICEAARRHARAGATKEITLQNVLRMCEIEGIDQIGLDPLERRYLQLLKNSQGPVRMNVLATQLAVPRKTVDMIESELIRLSLVTKTEAGRTLTAAGAKHLNETAQAEQPKAV
jgi:Holliday junction DNA helicase RuvB